MNWIDLVQVRDRWLALLMYIWGFHSGDYEDVVFWDVALCRTRVNRRFGGTYRLHLQGGIIRER
jgi:hypothetical protein